MRQRGGLAARLAAAVAGLACGASPPIEIPRCSAPEAKPAPSEACRSSSEFASYQRDLARALADQLRWKHSPSLPIGVEFDAQAALARVCVDVEISYLPWTERRELLRVNSKLRSLPSGPACLADSSLDLTGALIEASADSRDGAHGALGSCLTLRDAICLDQVAPVCGILPGGARQTFRNACEACQHHSLVGWTEGACSRL